MKAIWERIVKGSVRELIRAACMLSLAGLAIMSFSIFSPRPLAVILAMSVGQVIGGAGFACYLVAVVIDAASGPRATPTAAPVALADADSKPMRDG
jgi:hypothetical protein